MIQDSVFNVHHIKSNLYRNGRWRCFEQSLKETDHNCDPCDYRTDNIWKLKRHLTTARHLAAVNRNSGQVNENWSDNEASSGEITTNSAKAGNIKTLVEPPLRIENDAAFKGFNTVDKNTNNKEENKYKRAKNSRLSINKDQIHFTPNERIVTKRKSAINASEKVQSWLGELAKKR